MERKMLLKTFALTTLLATSTLFLTSSCNLKSYATNNCVSVDEDKIRYVNCALADIDANNGMGLTPYSFALMFKRSDIAQYLLEKTTNKSLFKRISAKILKLFSK